MAGNPSRNGFTPGGNYPKIKLPKGALEVPFPDVRTHGKIDPDKLSANFESLTTQLKENNRYLDRVEWGAGGGTRWATIVIAASDSTPNSRQTADFVCTGAADQTLINTVITALQLRGATTGVGRIVFLEGTYRTTDSIVVNALGARMIALVGMGAGGLPGTTISATRFVCTHATNPAFNFGGNPASSGSTVLLQDVQVQSAAGGCIGTRDMPTLVRDCALSGSGFGISQTNSTGTGAGSKYIDNTIAVTGGVGIFAAVGAGVDLPVTIAGNHITITGAQNGIQCGNSSSSIPTYIVTGNFVRGNSNASSIGILLNGNSLENCSVVGNTVQACGVGIACGGYRHIISGNVAESCTTGFSTSSDSQYLDLSGNNASQCAVGFKLADNAIRPTVIGNKASNCAGAYTVASGVTNAFIGYNDFGGVSGTDAGTSTMIITDLPSGGTSQFVLKKNSGTTGDFSWALDPAIDAITAKGSILAGTAVDALTSVTPAKNAQLFESDSTQTAGVKWSRRLFVQDTDPALSITPDLGDIWIDTT